MMIPEYGEERSEALRRVIEKATFIDRVSERPDRASLRVDCRARYLFILKRAIVVGLLGSAAISLIILFAYWVVGPVSSVIIVLLALLGFTIVLFLIRIYWYRPRSTARVAGPGQRRKASGHVWHADYKTQLRLDRELLQSRRNSHEQAIRSLRTCLLGYPLCIVLKDFRTIRQITGSQQARDGSLEYGTAWELNWGEDQSIDAKLSRLLLPISQTVSVASPVQTDIFHGRPTRIPQLELPDQGWADVVSDLIDAADWIVVIANRVTEGLFHELALVRERRKQKKTLVVTPDQEHMSLEDMMTTAGYNVMNPSTEMEPEVPADFSIRVSARDLEPEIVYSRLATAKMLNTLFMQTRSVREPWTVSHDIKQEQRLEQLIAELADAEAVQQTAENKLQLWKLLMTVSAASNELRHYMQSAVLAHRALKLMQEELSESTDAIFSCLLSRDGLLAALINMHNYPAATAELAHQLDDLEVALSADTDERSTNGFIQRIRLHLGRIRGESREPVGDLEARLAGLEKDRSSLSQLGGPAEEAVAAYRELAAADPGRYRPDLAIALSNLGIFFSELGRPAEALPVTEEAVAILRELAAADPGRYRPDLAVSQTNLGVWLSELGRPAEALPVTEEAVAAYRELAAADPGRYRPELASALVNLGRSLSELGRPAEGLPVTEEAVAIRRELAAANPGRYRPDLADSLINLGAWLSVLGRPADALLVTEEAVAIRRELAVANPGRYRPDLASALINLGVWFSALGRPAEALPVTEEAVAAYRELAAANPDRYRARLADLLARLAVVHEELGQTADADSMRAEATQVARTDR